MESWIDQLIGGVNPTVGPFIVCGLLLLSGIGIPISEDIIIIPAGMLVQQGALPLLPTVLAAYFGVVCGDLLWFIVCSKLGHRLLHKKWFKRMVHPKRMLQVKYQFDVRGIWVIILARFIPASRTSTIAVAGMMHMKFWKFASATAVCCLLTAPMQLFAGWWIADSIASKSTVELVVRLVGLAMVVVAFAWGYRLWSKHRKSGNNIPRAQISWLSDLPKKEKE
tara:strand:+ start:79 stop:747 length:669 start_codon:yes stop_codon:yes gene_type:complete